jgi:hypothetical protein
MPTLYRRTDKSTKVHPRQTDYYIKAKPPEVGYVTYQIDSRAVDFLTDDLGYGDEDHLAWSIVHPLRHIRDLYTLDEGKPRTTNPEDYSEDRVTVASIESEEIDALVAYLNKHPDVVGEIGEFRTRLERQDVSYTAVLERDGYTPTETPGFDSTGSESLDKIAQEVFGDATGGSITWDGQQVYDYIRVTDRDGNKHEFPRIDSRIPEGELLRLSRDIYERWGKQIGESEVISRRYEPSDEGFPNRWIGQRTESPEPSLEDAKSPRAFFYRTIAGRSHYAPGTKAEDAFDEVCKYSLEVYKANFPTAVDPNDLQTEYVTVEKATKQWNDFQVPPGWQDRFPDYGGIPPLKQDSNIGLEEPENSVLEEHGPHGNGAKWFDSEDEAKEHLTNDTYRDVLIAANQSNQNVTDFSKGGAGHPVFEVRYESLKAEIMIDRECCIINCESYIGVGCSFEYDGAEIAALSFDSTTKAKDMIGALGCLEDRLLELIEFADTLLDHA